VNVEVNASPDTIYVISEAVFTANHLTDTNKQNSTGKYTNLVQPMESKRRKIGAYSKTKLPWFIRFL